ncbi:MAG: substrate-binding domain-containing protein [Alphaproteobacteria bacterium]
MPDGRESAGPPARLADVAAAAGVSAATASRAFNVPDLVRPELRERIMAAAAELGYVAHGAARALASRRSRTLGAIVPTLNNTIFARTVDAFQRRLEERGYIMLLTSSEYDAERELERARALLERGVDGLMLVGAVHHPQLLGMLAAAGKPFVQGWALGRGARHPSVGYDARRISGLAVEHLVALGHREFAVLTGRPTMNDRVTARLQGLRMALRRHRLRIPASRILHCAYAIDAAREAFGRLVMKGELPTALVCGNDILACGALFEARARGIAVPERLSIVGNGDLDIAAHTTPALTTVRTPKAEIGFWAADYLMARIEGGNLALPAELPVELVPRGSSGPAPSTDLPSAAD